MAKATKTFKIGEYCKGGIITVEINGNVIDIIGKDWDTSAGYTKKSNQSNAKEFDRETVLSTDSNAQRKMMDFLEDLTTYYYASEVLDWIKSKVKLGSEFDW
jgi:NMD protein affecting ribosome stability and mRNA decay